MAKQAAKKKTAAKAKPAMPARTLKALKGSIRKWEEIVAGSGIDRATDNCPLCQLFIVANDTCSGCPVDSAGHHGCFGSPYDRWCGHCMETRTEDGGIERRAVTDAAMEAARAELRFLKSLLPKEARS